VPFSTAYDFNVVANAAVGCGAAVASGGKCGPGALAGGITAAAGPIINRKGFASLVANAALGGGVAVLGGGKFANGAITGAFGYLFSSMAHSGNEPSGGFLADDQFADTHVGWDGNIVVRHFALYDTLTWPEQLAVDVHEGVHVEQYLAYAGQGMLGAVQAFLYGVANRPALEIPAYSKEL
jgi:hypothetical protein